MADLDTEEFKKLLKEGWGELGLDKIELVLSYRELVLQENTRQNLTRLISPLDFFRGHVLDVRALLQSEFLHFPALDLGSGQGVPGILCAIAGGGRWVLAESEQRKAEFLRFVCLQLSLVDVEVYCGRAENFLKNRKVNSVVVRAVGSIERVYSLIRGCSTWNNLILFKGPKWDEEWHHFQKKSFKNKLRIKNKFEYAVSPGSGGRWIIQLERCST